MDELADRAKEAGGVFSKPPVEAEAFAGRDAYFSDPEANFWEIAWPDEKNPVVIAARRAAGFPA